MMRKSERLEKEFKQKRGKQNDDLEDTIILGLDDVVN